MRSQRGETSSSMGVSRASELSHKFGPNPSSSTQSSHHLPPVSCTSPTNYHWTKFKHVWYTHKSSQSPTHPASLTNNQTGYFGRSNEAFGSSFEMFGGKVCILYCLLGNNSFFFLHSQEQLPMQLYNVVASLNAPLHPPEVAEVNNPPKTKVKHPNAQHYWCKTVSQALGLPVLPSDTFECYAWTLLWCEVVYALWHCSPWVNITIRLWCINFGLVGTIVSCHVIDLVSCTIGHYHNVTWLAAYWSLLDVEMQWGFDRH